MATDTLTVEPALNTLTGWNIPPTENEVATFEKLFSNPVAGIRYFNLIAARVTPVNGYAYSFICAAETTNWLENTYLVKIDVWEYLGRLHIQSITKTGPVPFDGPGGWRNWKFPASTNAVSVLNNALHDWLGAEYNPLGSTSQLVNGINYCLLCQQTPAIEHPVKKPCLVYIYQGFHGKPHIEGITML